MSRASTLFIVLFFLACSGCGASLPELVEVEGVVMMNGSPLPEVMVKFLPDPETGNMAQPSSALTGPDGSFKLEYKGEKGLFGAAVGMHRIVLTDYMSINSRDNPVPYRFSNLLVESASTPLKQDVKAGMESVTIDISDYTNQ